MSSTTTDELTPGSLVAIRGQRWVVSEVDPADVFRDRTRQRAARRWFRAKYDAELLRAALTDVFGERAFGESTKH